MVLPARKVHLKKARAAAAAVRLRAKLPLVLDSIGSSAPPATRVAILTKMRELREFQNKTQAALQDLEHKMETLTNAYYTAVLIEFVDTHTHIYIYPTYG